jgi:pimeloyl-ACP methyl ester carboxylesterase
MHFFEYGRPDGIPLVFLMGTPHTGEGVPELVDLAAEIGIRLICPIRSWYADTTIEPSFETCTAQVIRYLEQNGIKYAFALGGSGGGPFALHLTSNHADTFDACYLLASMGDPDVFKQTVASPHTQTLLKLFSHNDYDHAIEQLGQWGMPPAMAHGVWTDFQVLFGSWRTINFTSPVPVFIHHGDSDENAPLESVQMLASKLANSELRISPHASHLAFANREFNELRTIFSEISERSSARSQERSDLAASGTLWPS